MGVFEKFVKICETNNIKCHIYVIGFKEIIAVTFRARNHHKYVMSVLYNWVKRPLLFMLKIYYEISNEPNSYTLHL